LLDMSSRYVPAICRPKAAVSLFAVN
jgi:hypothetical protein